MAEKTGIKETIEFGRFINAGIKSAKDFKARGIKPTPINLLKSFGDFLPATALAPDAFENANHIPKEWADLDKDEARQIMDVVNEGIDLKDKLTETEVEEVFGATLLAFVAWKNLIQKNNPE